MTALDLVIRNATVVTATDTFEADIGVAHETIVELDPPGQGPRVSQNAAQEIDAAGKLVLPGGVDSHTHIEQLSAAGVMNADDFYSATVSAAFGGTTTTMSFAAQHRGMRIPDVVDDYHQRAATKAIIDYAFHLIVADPTPETLSDHLPAAIAQGVASFKLYMTYDRLMVNDAQILDVLATARTHGALTMVHAENHAMIGWMSQRVVAAGNTLPRYHAVCHTRGAEAEAINRLITLAELADAPVLVVHVSTIDGIDEIRQARAQGLKVYGETCPQYLFLTSDDLNRGGLDGAMFCCSPPPRDREAQEACWAGLLDGTLQVYSSDHAPFRFDDSGKLPNGDQTTFKEIANGVPGLELRMPVLYTEGVGSGRLTVNQFVDITSTQHAKIYGLYPRKGTIAVGSDADLAVWDPDRELTITNEMVHDNVGYTPYAGRHLRGWPETVVSRGEVIIADGELRAERGRGQFLARTSLEAAKPLGRDIPEIEQMAAWGTPFLR
ncbi:MAG: dihydropyrimidinase [Actinomycetia bacterium]|nr:dihydropyrimidinase [Actinomycetes bacterium]MCP5032687.1 dihydropyrimidinase [Actinomycetes bacterium]